MTDQTKPLAPESEPIDLDHANLLLGYDSSNPRGVLNITNAEWGAIERELRAHRAAKQDQTVGAGEALVALERVRHRILETSWTRLELFRDLDAIRSTLTIQDAKIAELRATTRRYCRALGYDDTGDETQ